MDTSTSTDERISYISFTASKWEYFKLWIVNMVLTVFTLGIYSAWAKVRNTQYIYGHTQVEGHRLQYLATPMQLLKGRLIALIFFIAYSVLSSLIPMLGLLLALLVWLASPYLMYQGLRFNLRQTAYRNVRFGFVGSVKGAYVNFLLLPLLSILTLGLALPWVLCRINRYIYNNLKFGEHAFTANLSGKLFYKAALIAFLTFLIPVIILFVVAFQMLQSSGPSFAMIMTSYVMFFVAFGVYSVMVRNHILNALEAHNLVKFESNLRLDSYLGVMATNALIVTFTLGLGFPVAEVRHKKMLADATRVHLYPEIDNLVASSGELDSAFGEELSGFFDSDLSLT